MTMDWVAAAGSLSLVAMAVALSLWRGLGIERSLVWAAGRAAIQLVAVGLLFRIIFSSAHAPLWAWLWVAGMVVTAGYVISRRSPSVPNIGSVGLVAVAFSVAISLALVFGFGVFDLEPVTIVVIAGITIGNTLPSAVLGATQMSSFLRDHTGQVEALLALGMDGKQVSRFVVPRVARTALIPQIERTKVVGLVALPGAMTGLLLAGVDPFDAVLVQLVIMYLILGAVALSVLVVVITLTARSLTPDLRLADWTTRP